ncbi:MAG: hypothetical protein ACI9LM_004739 [Alteromonadaceae bacterium]|jgi:hypothetical protein
MSRLTLYPMGASEVMLAGEFSNLFKVELIKSQLSIFKDKKLIATIGLNHFEGKYVFKGTQLKIKNRFSTIEIKGYELGDILISTSLSKKWCEPLSLNVFLNQKKIAYFRASSKYIFFDKKYDLIYNKSCDFDFIVMLLVYLHNAVTDLSTP